MTDDIYFDLTFYLAKVRLEKNNINPHELFNGGNLHCILVCDKMNCCHLNGAV